MENCPSDAFDTAAAAWFLAAMQAYDGDPAQPGDGTPPNVIIAVSLDELDGMTGDMLV
jgi:hypothetical protein